MQRYLRYRIQQLFAVVLLGFGVSLALIAPSQAQQRTILVLGDSISAAYGMSLDKGWVALLSQRLDEEYPHYAVVNASISGETSAGGLRRLPKLLTQHTPSVVIIELGGNDGLRGYPTAKLQQNLSAMAELASDTGAQVMILPMEIPPNYGRRYTDSFRQSFVEAAEESGARLAGFFLDNVATDKALMQGDGIHPNQAAQALLLENAYPVLEALLETP